MKQCPAHEELKVNSTHSMIKADPYHVKRLHDLKKFLVDK